MVTCLLCHGKGVWFFGMRECPDCKGEGRVTEGKYHDQVVRRNRGIDAIERSKRDERTKN